MAIVAIVYHSGFGHTKLQAEAVHRGAGSVAGVEARLYTERCQRAFRFNRRTLRLPAILRLHKHTASA
ncbi:MAG: hypothetical protein WB696_27895 [Chthoniobacterales bacterium]